MQNTLYYGDNLKVLREHIADASVDLIYLDPPFNSNRSYNVLFRDESGSGSDAQITAFDDAWHWGETAERTYDGLISTAPLNVSMMIESMRKFIGANQMMAYLVMMAARIVELHRVLKPSGSLYLHCDPTASHYLKILMDTIFGVQNYVNEIAWKRTSAHNTTTRKYGDVLDILLFYSKSDSYLFNSPRKQQDKDYSDKFYRFKDPDGRAFRLHLIERNAALGIRPNLIYEYKGYIPKLGWMMEKSKLEELDKRGKLVWSSNGRPSRKIYLDEVDKQPISNLWDDVIPIQAQAAEKLGYPTQKPLALLERILQASSNPGDLVLDPFSGCGTCIAAAQKLGRNWIGIDITHLAIAMHKARLKDMFGLEAGKDYRIVGEPEDLDGARQLKKDDPYQFQWWALSLIGARPYGGAGEGKAGKKGSDRGVDGMIYFQGEKDALGKAIVQVKSGHVNSAHIRDLKGVLEREKSGIGIFLTLEEPSREMQTEAVSTGFYHSEIWQKNYPRIQILTVEEILAGKRPDLPPTPQGASAFKKAEKVKRGEGKQGELGI